MRTCEVCGRDISSRQASARTCGQRCRQRARRARPTLPAELTSRPRWVRWSSAKVPLTVGGAAASSTDPATWTTHELAAASSAGAGVGFVLDGDGVCCVDLDHVLVDGVPTPAAAQLLAELPPTYVEVSPGGDGLHVWFVGSVGHDGVHLRDVLRFEAYSRGRYVTVTGRRFGNAPTSLALFDLA